MSAGPQEQVRFCRPQHLSGLELVATSYGERAFPRHIHDEYVIGTMTEGAERLTIRGQEHVAAEGDLILIEPGEPHSNRSAGSGRFGYVVMYVPVPLMAQAMRDLSSPDPVHLPRFREPVAQMKGLDRLLLKTHRRLSGPCGRLEQESAFLHFVSRLRDPLLGQTCRTTVEQHKIRRAREYLDDRYRESVSLHELADIAGLSPFHFLRTFREQVGLPPAAYQTHRRIAQAKHLLRSRCSIAEVAADLGFADQSHLSRHFQRIVGTTPGKYIQQ
jgi:AraC-like DNA-binding protein/mannose-6-phosphate isomerase-like protein (cupin superfamily)